MLFNLDHILNLEPVKLIGEGKYNLDALKEIRVTQSYLRMDMDIKKCQNEEPLENCTTRTYMESFLQQCGCLPLQLSSFKNVIQRIYFIILLTHQENYNKLNSQIKLIQQQQQII